MKLSEAIRAGSKLRPQAFGLYYNKLEKSSCALGAACEAMGTNLENYPANPYDYFEKTLDLKIKLPSFFNKKSFEDFHLFYNYSNEGKFYVGQIIQYLNDIMKIPREEIATWLEQEGF